MAHTRFKFAFVLIMFVALAVLTSLLWLRYEGDIKKHKELQQLLMQQQAFHSAKGIDTQIGYFRHQMSAIALDDLWLTDISQFESLVTIQENMRDRLKLYFPEMHAFTVTSEHGKQLGGDVELVIGQICQTDIYKLSSMFQPQVPYFDYEPYLHAKPGEYHFDIMIPVFVHSQKLVFFMSFKASILSRILNEHIISSHQSFLVRQDIPNLIEVSPTKVREQFTRSHKLSEDEMAQIAVKVDVANSKWAVVVLENPGIMREFKTDKQADLAVFLAVLLMFWSSVLWLGLNYDSRRGHLVNKLNHLSLHDPLTGVANRRKIASNIANEIELAKQSRGLSVLLYMDLNGFKAINDNYGHNKGDLLLIELAKRLQALGRHEDLVARVGGDEFVVLLSQVGFDKESAQTALQDALKRFNENLNGDYDLGEGIQVYCKPSIGGIVIDENKKDVESLLQEADHAMYQVKNLRK